MLFLILAILSSSIIAIFMRISSNRVSANLSMLAVNYLVCVCLGAVYADFDPAASTQASFGITILMGIVSGFLYLGGFVLFQHNTRKNGMVLSSIFMKLGLLVPVVMSVLLFKEAPTVSQIGGFLLAVFAIVLINLKKDCAEKDFGPGLILMLLMCGGSDAMSKVFERIGPSEFSDFYLLCTFTVAFFLCVGLVLYKKEKPGVQEILFGTLIGIPNFFSAKFLLGALVHIPAVIVYPVYSVGTILAVSLTGVLAFRERLEKRQWIGMGMILVALVLLNV